jgi:hypothetical protein
VANTPPTHLLAGVEDLASATESILVDNEALEPAISPTEAALQEHNADLERERTDKFEQSKLVAAGLPSLTLSSVNLERGRQVRRAFEESGPDAEVAERLLEELTAGEVPVAMQLQDIEGALVAMLGRAILEPEAALQITKILRETVALSGAVRTRMQNALGAAANLRAQRRFLAAQKGRTRV